MKNYKIEGIINNKTKKTDEDSVHRIGKLVNFDVDEIEKGKSLTMKDIDKNSYIRTSPVANCFIDNKDVYVETKNRIYKFTENE